jgi:hypothetical protein
MTEDERKARELIHALMRCPLRLSVDISGCVVPVADLTGLSQKVTGPKNDN